MPVRLLVRAENSPTFPASGSWAKGDIVEARALPSPLGLKERPPLFVVCDLTFQNAPDPSWVQEQIDAEGGRRTIGLSSAEVDSIIAVDPVNGIKTYSSAGQFVSRLEAKKTGTAALFVGSDEEKARELAFIARRADELDEKSKQRELSPGDREELAELRRRLDAVQT